MGFSSLQIAINAEIIYVRITMSLSRSSNALLQAARYLVFAAAANVLSNLTQSSWPVARGNKP